MGDDVPDIYTDGASVGAGPFGITMTLLRSMPGPSAGRDISVDSDLVARIRLSYPLARDLVRLLQEAISAEGKYRAEIDERNKAVHGMPPPPGR